MTLSWHSPDAGLTETLEAPARFAQLELNNPIAVTSMSSCTSFPRSVPNALAPMDGPAWPGLVSKIQAVRIERADPTNEQPMSISTTPFVAQVLSCCEVDVRCWLLSCRVVIAGTSFLLGKVLFLC
jgi:hypothetical protein